LEVHHLSKQLAKMVYTVVTQFPAMSSTASGVSSKGRRLRSCLTLPRAKDAGQGFVRFLYQARGSLLEVVRALDLSKSLESSKHKGIQNIFDPAFTLNAKLTLLIKALEPKT